MSRAIQLQPSSPLLTGLGDGGVSAPGSPERQAKVRFNPGDGLIGHAHTGGGRGALDDSDDALDIESLQRKRTSSADEGWV